MEVASFELFVDLLFVGILAINGDHVGDAPDGNEVHRFVVTFIMCMTPRIRSCSRKLIRIVSMEDLVRIGPRHLKVRDR